LFSLIGKEENLKKQFLPFSYHSGCSIFNTIKNAPNAIKTITITRSKIIRTAGTPNKLMGGVMVVFPVVMLTFVKRASTSEVDAFIITAKIAKIIDSIVNCAA